MGSSSSYNISANTNANEEKSASTPLSCTSQQDVFFDIIRHPFPTLCPVSQLHVGDRALYPNDSKTTCLSTCHTRTHIHTTTFSVAFSCIQSPPPRMARLVPHASSRSHAYTHTHTHTHSTPARTQQDPREPCKHGDGRLKQPDANPCDTGGSKP